MVRVIGIVIPVALLLIYLIITGAISEFINYAILGIKTFSNKIPYKFLLNNNILEIKILSNLIPISILISAIILIIIKIQKKETDNTKKWLTMLMYSLAIIIVIYPISDVIHFLIGTIIAIIQVLYILALLGKYVYKKIKYNKKYKVYKIITLIISELILSLILVISISNLYIYINIEKNTEIEHYKNIRIDEDLKSRIDTIDQYILEKEKEGIKVYVLDAEAAMQMVPINKYNKDYDMFLNGNIGKDGQQGQIEKIKVRNENTLYLIRQKDISQNWQTPTQVIEYIRNNLKQIDTIDIYEVYK